MTELLTYCNDCGDRIEDDDANHIDNLHAGYYVCSDCITDYTPCSACSSYVAGSAVAYRRNDLLMCVHCCEDFGFCYECGELLRFDESESYNGDFYHIDCLPDFKMNLHRHDYKPSPIFNKMEFEDGVNRYYGVELEVDNGEDKDDLLIELSDISNKENLFYCKKDGSLTNGLEIVTHPMTLAYHMVSMPWDMICEVSKANGFKSHNTDTCGLHVHVNRSSLGEKLSIQTKTIGNILAIVDKFFYPELVSFSRRDVTKLAEWAKKPNANINNDDSIEDIEDKVYRNGRDRYKAFNTCPSRTVEFRLFRGTLKPTTILASLQLCEMIIRKAQSIKHSDLKNLSWIDIVGDTEFEELTSYLRFKKLYEGDN